MWRALGWANAQQRSQSDPHESTEQVLKRLLHQHQWDDALAHARLNGFDEDRVHKARVEVGGQLDADSVDVLEWVKDTGWVREKCVEGPAVSLEA